MTDTDQALKAEQTALRLLAGREHSRAQLRGKLQVRGYAAGLVDAVLERLQEQGLLNERRFTEVYIASRRQRGYGPLRIRAELRERGIDERLIGEEMARVEGEWGSMLRRAHHKKYGPDRPTDFNERVRRTRFLEYRGFSGDQVRRFLCDDE